MQLTVCLPQKILIQTGVVKVTAESAHGLFCLLPRHIDCLTVLVPGLLTYLTPEGSEKFLAIDEGILVKCGEQVRVSTRHGIQGQDLLDLQRQVRQHFQTLDEQERRTRAALAKLEAGLVRHFITDLS
ncbi:F0F1 ATP synthase subunit epsilon [Lyngbya confervoides]|uniref:F0F1 ATP synthase subunit epsilon n=1 Tax=Lyngbya confervoides BDU141951 TaxID=1574623 RepID=A0ABD4T8I1_9CYAN|nr:F0F1 ATP synthase subunit epsilon [Lyngbya confervoides]MCM1984936.1 F0F1 ATP synthase subunit epsilon [Lyngbya confervoides BDU141951]